MFTGLVEETGVITSLTRRRGGVTFEIGGRKTLKGLAVDDSVSVQGVCLTVVRKKRSTFVVQVIEETLSKTTLGLLDKGDSVNLERALLATDRLGGHFVLGHVDNVGTVEGVERLGTSSLYWIRVRKIYRKWLIPVGSVAVDGISLTIARTRGSSFAVAIIPHTTEVTTAGTWKMGSKVNVEFDVLGKYIENLVRYRTRPRRKAKR